MEDTGKRSLGQKFKDKLHIGQGNKSSAASDASDYSNQVGQEWYFVMFQLSMAIPWHPLTSKLPRGCRQATVRCLP